MAKESFDLQDAVGGDGIDPLMSKIQQLENQLEAERDHRREDRFLAVVIVMILLDLLLLNSSQAISVPLIVLVLELLFLIVVAKRLGVEQIAGILDRLLNRFAQRQAG